MGKSTDTSKKGTRTMKRILGSLIIVALVIGITGLGFAAYFSDTETSSGNTFTAGTIDLTLAESAGAPITLTNMKPGESASGTITVNNAGSLPGCLYATSWYVTADGAVNLVNKSDDAVAKMLLITAFTADGTNMLPAIPEVDGNPGRSVYDMVNDPSGMPLPNYPASPGELGTWYSYDANMTVGVSHIYVLTVQFDPLAPNAYQGDGITWTLQFLLTQQP